MLAKCLVPSAVFALALAWSGSMALAQSYPSRAITAIIPFAGGSASDVVSRIVFDKMSKSMGQPIIVENRPGAGGNIGTAMGAKAAPDGYTIVGGGSGPVAANLTLYKSLGYDPEKDLEMISPFAGFTIVIVVSKSLPVGSWRATVTLVSGITTAVGTATIRFAPIPAATASLSAMQWILLGLGGLALVLLLVMGRYAWQHRRRQVPA